MLKYLNSGLVLIIPPLVGGILGSCIIKQCVYFKADCVITVDGREYISTHLPKVDESVVRFKVDGKKVAIPFKTVDVHIER